MPGGGDAGGDLRTVADKRQHEQRSRRLADPGAQLCQHVKIGGDGACQTFAALLDAGCGGDDANLPR